MPSSATWRSSVKREGHPRGRSPSSARDRVAAYRGSPRCVGARVLRTRRRNPVGHHPEQGPRVTLGYAALAATLVMTVQALEGERFEAKFPRNGDRLNSKMTVRLVPGASDEVEVDVVSELTELLGFADHGAQIVLVEEFQRDLKHRLEPDGSCRPTGSRSSTRRSRLPPPSADARAGLAPQ